MYNLYSETHCQVTTCPYFRICDQVPCRIFQSEYREAHSAVDILFISEFPNWKESQLRNHWVTSVGRMITKLMESDYPDKTFAVTSAVRGWAYKPESLIDPKYNGSKPSHMTEYVLSKAKTAPVNQNPNYYEILKNCKGHLDKDIQLLRPKMIVVMGTTALNSMFPNEKRSILELTDVSLEYNGIPVRVTTSSNFIMARPALKVTWVQKLRNILEGKVQAYFDYKPEWKLLTTVPEVLELLDRLESDRKPVTLDTETENLNKRHGTQLGMVQLANDPYMIYAIPWVHFETPFTSADLEVLKARFQKFFASPNIPQWNTFNGKFELNIIANALDASIETKIYDALAGEFLLDENRVDRVSEYKHGVYSLKQVALDRLGYDGWDTEVLKFRGDGSLMDLPLLKIAEYGCDDVGLTHLIVEHQIAQAEKEGYTNFLPLVFGLYDPIVKVFAQVERDGFPASRDYVRSMITRTSPLLAKVKELQDQICATPEGQRANKLLLERSTRTGAGGINPLVRTPMILDMAKQNHPQTLFFEVMGLEPIVVSETGTASVDTDFQDKYASNPIVAMFAQWVEAKKMFDSFVKPLYDYLDPAGTHTDSKFDQRIRPNYTLSKVVTGRIACSSPNLQAIPRADSEVKKWIKNIFQVREKGRILVQLDYKANEMRWVGIAAGDLAMAKKFNQGKEALDRFRRTLDPNDFKLATLYGDVHKQNAASAFKKSIEEITKDQRQAAKGISFGVLYDSTEKSVADLYNLDLQETINMFQGFYQEHHWIYGWKMEMKEMARTRGYVEAPHGRRRRFPIFDLYRNEHGWFDDNLVPRDHRSMVADALRQSSNAPIQGVASDAANIGANNLRMYIKRKHKDWRLCNVVHDSCVVDIPFQDLDEYIEASEKLFTTDVMTYMTDLWDIDFILPLEIDLDFGVKWGDLKSWDFSPSSLIEIKRELEQLVL